MPYWVIGYGIVNGLAVGCVVEWYWIGVIGCIVKPRVGTRYERLVVLKRSLRCY